MEHNSGGLEVWKIIVLPKWMICRFHVNLPGCRHHTTTHAFFVQVRNPVVSFGTRNLEKKNLLGSEHPNKLDLEGHAPQVARLASAMLSAS